MRSAHSRSEPALRTRTNAARAPALTHPDRLVYPELRISKREVADYYATLAARVLAEVAGRPLSVVRCPGGVAPRRCFFQKHPADALGANVRSIRLREASGAHDEYLYIETAKGLLDLVQMNVIEFHPWGARVDDPEHPDRLVFDLDPGSDVPWSTLVRAARDVRTLLREQRLQSFVRLSGGKGVHVVAPIRRGPAWNEAKDFCESVARTLAARQPKLYLAESSKAKREGRIFIDWLRNTRGATSVASWSLRARADPSVAMPLAWNQLARSAAQISLRSALRRARLQRSDAWRALRELDQPLSTYTAT